MQGFPYPISSVVVKEGDPPRPSVPMYEFEGKVIRYDPAVPAGVYEVMIRIGNKLRRGPLLIQAGKLVLEEPARCPNCPRAIVEKTLAEPA
jgi:hypothetical protein